MKKHVVLFIMLAFFVLILLQNCKPDKKQHPFNIVAHRSIVIEEFKRLTRTEQVKKCGSCHIKEFESEMKGPHSAAFNNYYNHLVYTWSDEYKIEPYRSFLTTRKGHCAGCHAGENIFEKTFGSDMLAKTELSDSLKLLLGSGPQCRSANNIDLITGIDCITCHFDGNHVIASAAFSPSLESKIKSPAYCQPKGSALFSSNNNCITCHYEETEVTANQTLLTSAKDKSCVNCHQQYDANGKGTHYYYWRNDSTDKIKPARLQLFDGIEATYQPLTKQIEVKWFNKIMPHLLTRATQTKAVLRVTNEAGIELSSSEILLNRRGEHMEELTPYFGAGKEPGTSGQQLSLNGTPILHTIKNIKIELGQKLYLVITGYQKAQYWFPESFNKKIYERTIVLNN